MFRRRMFRTGAAILALGLFDPGASAQPAPNVAKPTKMSKFEARKARHACRDRANEHGLKGQERDAYVARCYFKRLANPGLRRDCRHQGVAKGLEKIALRDYVRECVRERTRVNQQPANEPAKTPEPGKTPEPAKPQQH